MFYYFLSIFFTILDVHKYQYKYEIRNFCSSVAATQSGAVIYLRAQRSRVQHSGTTCYNMRTTVHLLTQCTYVPRMSLSKQRLFAVQNQPVGYYFRSAMFSMSGINYLINIFIQTHSNEFQTSKVCGRVHTRRVFKCPWKCRWAKTIFSCGRECVGLWLVYSVQ